MCAATVKVLLLVDHGVEPRGLASERVVTDPSTQKESDVQSAEWNVTALTDRLDAQRNIRKKRKKTLLEPRKETDLIEPYIRVSRRKALQRAVLKGGRPCLNRANTTPGFRCVNWNDAQSVEAS